MATCTRDEVIRRLTALLTKNADELLIELTGGPMSETTRFIRDYTAGDDQKSLNLDSLGLVEAFTAIGTEFGVANMDDADHCETIGFMADFLVAHATK